MVRDPPAAPVAGDPVAAHHPGHPLVVDPLAVGHTVVELGGDPRRPVGVVLVVHHPDPLGQCLVSGLAGRAALQHRPTTRRTTTVRPPRPHTATSPRRRAGGRRRTGSGSPVRLPGEIFRRRPQNVPLGGQLPLGDLQLGHPRFEPGDPLASGSPSAGTTALLADGFLVCNGLVVSVPSAAVFLPVPYPSSQCRSVPRTTPRSAAIPRTVAPGVDSNKSTASTTGLLGVVLPGNSPRSSRFPQQMLDSACSKNQGQAPRLRHHPPGPGRCAGLVLRLLQPRPPAQLGEHDEPDRLRQRCGPRPGSRIGKPSTIRGGPRTLTAMGRRRAVRAVRAETVTIWFLTVLVGNTGGLGLGRAGYRSGSVPSPWVP